MEVPPATGRDSGRDASRYTLSVEQASELFAQAGVPRSPRSVQRYCKHSVLDAIAIETDANEKYLIEPGSVERRITELKQIFQAFGNRHPTDATGRDVWPAAGSKDTELGVFMEPEVDHGATEVYAGVQA